MFLANEIAMYIDIVITLVDENVSGLQSGTLMRRWRQKRYLSRQVEGKNRESYVKFSQRLNNIILLKHLWINA